MTLLLIFQDGMGAATGSEGSAPSGGSAVAAVHRKVGVRQQGVPSHGGGGGLAGMFGWLRGLSFG